MARVGLPAGPLRSQVLNLFAYQGSDGREYATFQYANGVAYLPPNLEKLQQVAALLGEELLDSRSHGAPLSEPFKLSPAFAFRGYQQQPADELLAAVRVSTTGTMEAGCGTGKTVVMTWVGGHLGCKILVLVDQSNLLDQWADAFRLIWNRRLQVIESSTKHFGDCCIATFQLLHRNRELLGRLRKEFGVVMVDECHGVKAATFTAVMQRLDSKYRIGCSATFFGKNLPQGVLVDMVGPGRAVMLDAGALVPKVVQVKTGVSFSSGSPDDFGSKILPDLAGNDARNAAVFDLIRRMAADGRRTLVICIKNDQAKLYHLLCQKVGISSTLYVGTTSARRDRQVKDDMNAGKLQVVFTSKKLDKGTDIESADCLIMTKPSNNKAAVQQLAGRVVRKLDGKPQPMIYDLVDGGGLAETFARNRLRWYREWGYDFV
jgi:superfamily II DNA or RNA helicase